MLSELHANHKLSFGQFPAGPDQNSNCFADSADGWHFLTTTSKNAVLGREKQSRNPAGCGECDRQGDMWSWLGVESNRDDPEVATWSASHLAPGAVEQYPLIFHSPSYVPAASFPTATLVLAYLLMTSPRSANETPHLGLDGSKWVLPFWAKPPLQLHSQTRDMSLCDGGYYSAL